MKMQSLALAATVLVAAMGSAHADVFSVSGTISLSDPVYNRPLTTTSLSAVGTAVHYDTFLFGGASGGAYDFRMVSVPAGALDTFLSLYSGTFNPAAPLTNLLAINDDFGGVTTNGSGFTFTLTAGAIYTVVSTTFANTGAGNYLTTVTPVPEPATYALMALGLLAIGGSLRRRIG